MSAAAANSAYTAQSTRVERVILDLLEAGQRGRTLAQRRVALEPPLRAQEGDHPAEPGGETGDRPAQQLLVVAERSAEPGCERKVGERAPDPVGDDRRGEREAADHPAAMQIGRASCREGG